MPSSAVAVQAAMAVRNKGLPQDQRMLYRIGINLSDILIEGDDILSYGSMSQPGSKPSQIP